MNTYLGYNIKTVDIRNVFYNDDMMIVEDGGIRDDVLGWWSPEGTPNRDYYFQTGQMMRSMHGDNFTRADHLRSRNLYKNLKKSIEENGLKAPLVVVRWYNDDKAPAIPARWAVWEEFWKKKSFGMYYRVIQGNNRLMVLKDLKWTEVPVIDITDEARTLRKFGICPAKAWVDSPMRKQMENAAIDIGYDVGKAHIS